MRVLSLFIPLRLSPVEASQPWLSPQLTWEKRVTLLLIVTHLRSKMRSDLRSKLNFQSPLKVGDHSYFSRPRRSFVRNVALSAREISRIHGPLSRHGSVKMAANDIKPGARQFITISLGNRVFFMTKKRSSGHRTSGRRIHMRGRGHIRGVPTAASTATTIGGKN
jgi:hypothetical protein